MERLMKASSVWYYFVNADRIMINKNKSTNTWTTQFYSEESECVVTKNTYNNFDDVVNEAVLLARRIIYYYIQPLKGVVNVEFPSDERLKEIFLKNAVVVEE